jgi:hypothetical protein
LSGKWLELLKDIVPGLARVAVLRDADNPVGTVQFGAIQATAHPLGVEAIPINVHDAGEIERAVANFARAANGLIVAPSAEASPYHGLILTLAARHKLPAVYSDYPMVRDGGLISYGPDRIDQFRRAASYIDRILKGEKPADLPVQAPTKYELVINRKTAQTLGITMTWRRGERKLPQRDHQPIEVGGDDQSHLAARQRQHCAVLVCQYDPARPRANRNARAGGAVYTINVERRSDIADRAYKIGRRGAESKSIAHSPDRDRISSAVENQRAATARAAHDKTGLDNVKADAAEVGVDGREPGAGYSQRYQCSTNCG